MSRVVAPPVAAPPAALANGPVQVSVATGAAGFLTVGALWLATRYGPRQGALLLVGAALGLTLHHAVFGFTAAYRALVTVGDARRVRTAGPCLLARRAPARRRALVAPGAGDRVAAGRSGAVAARRGRGPPRAPQPSHARRGGHAVVHHLGLRALGREGARRDGIRPLGRRVLVGRVPADGARGAHPRRRHVGHGPRAGPGRAARRGARRPLRPAASRPGAPRRRGGPGRAPPRVRLTDRLWLQHRRALRRDRVDEPARLALGRGGARRYAARRPAARSFLGRARSARRRERGSVVHCHSLERESPDEEVPMVRITVLYPAGEGKKFDHDYFVRKHLALVRERLGKFGLVRTEADKGVAGGAPGAPAPYVAVAHVYFNRVADFQKGMGEHGKEIMGDIPNYTNIQPQVQISEIIG